MYLKIYINILIYNTLITLRVGRYYRQLNDFEENCIVGLHELALYFEKSPEGSKEVKQLCVDGKVFFMRLRYDHRRRINEMR